MDGHDGRHGIASNPYSGGWSGGSRVDGYRLCVDVAGQVRPSGFAFCIVPCRLRLRNQSIPHQLTRRDAVSRA